MATTLREVTQRAMDLYYQDYAPRDAFFDIDDFKFQVAIYYSAQLNTMFQAERSKTKREDGFSNVELSPSWIITEPVSVKWDDENEEYSATTKYDIFSFDFDNFPNGLQGVKSTPKQKFRKVSLNELKFMFLMPESTKTYFHVCGKNKIVFTCPVHNDKATVYYIPSVVGNDDNCVLSDNIVADVIKNVLTIMFGAKNGNVIQEANDGNKNAMLPGQENKQLNK